MEEQPKKLTLEYVNVDDLKESPNNCRTEIPGMLDKSIQRYTFYDPILINSENVVINGRMRLRAAKRLGLKEVPCVRIDLPENLQEEIRIADNKITEESSNWDWCGLTKELKRVGDMPQFLLTVNQYSNEYVDRYFQVKSQHTFDFDEE